VSLAAAFATDPLGAIMGMLGGDITDGINRQGNGGSAWAKPIFALPGDIVGGIILAGKGP
jgi:hypothetical protein